MSVRPAFFGLLLLCAVSRGSAAAEGWRVLPLVVDGRIDAAWRQVDWGGFVVDGGALRTEPDPRGMGLLVYTREQFGDCRIRVVYRSEKPQSNAGVFVRMDHGILSRLGEKTRGVERLSGGGLSPEMGRRMTEDADRQLGAWYAVHHGFEVQIADAADSWHRTGSIYSLAEAAAVPPKPAGEWRTMIITLDGDRISVEVDEVTVSKFDSSSPNLPPRRGWSEPLREIRRPTHGYIGLQNHDPGDVVWFKEVAVRRLKQK